MLRTALRNLRAHRARLLMSVLSIVLGVAFTSGTMVFTDSLDRTFTDLFRATAADVNIEPRSTLASGLDGTGLDSSTSTVPATVVEEVAAVPGVRAAEGYVQAEGVYVLDRDGEVVDTGGAPGLGVSWGEDGSLSQSTILDGRAPERSGEVAIDVDTAKDLGHHVGDTVTVLTTGPRVEATLVGVFRFGESGGLAGASLTAFDLATAQELLLSEGQFTGISVAAEDGVSDTALAERVSAAIGDDYDVTTREQKADDRAASMRDSLSFINTFLLVFAGIALFVGSFIILNTFSVLVAQRTRELALLRALGAGRAQVTRAVLVEALLLGLVGSTLGLLGGYGVAHALEAVFGQFGLTLDSGLVLTGPTVVWAYAVGVLVTLVAAYLPARRASRIPPVAAMRADLVAPNRSLRARTLAGVAGAVLSAAAILGGIAFEEFPLVGIGAAAMVLASIVLAPVLAVPFLRTAGAPLPRLFGRTGQLARDNALRNPRRTAATSSALMIGLALVTAFSIIGSSASASVDRIVDDVLEADYVVTTSMGQPFTPEVAARLASVDGVESVTQERYGVALIDGKQATFAAYDPAGLAATFDIPIESGDLTALDGDALVLSANEAEARGLAVGDQVSFELANGASRSLTVGGTYGTGSGLANWVVSMQTYDETGNQALDRAVYVHLAPSTDPARVRDALEQVVDTYPVVDIKDAGEFKDDQRASVDQMLMLINALLALSVLIAVLGVVNTLALSVIERTREIGLLRTLGMTRRQLRRTVRLESLLIAVYGAVLGVVLGCLTGLALTTVLHGQGLTETAVPTGRVVVCLVLGALIGVVAAAAPARRASRLDVLEAIATS